MALVEGDLLLQAGLQGETIGKAGCRDPKPVLEMRRFQEDRGLRPLLRPWHLDRGTALHKRPKRNKSQMAVATGQRRGSNTISSSPLR